MPEIIVIETTNRCNLDCMHCNKKINGMEGDTVADIPVDLVDKILDEAKPFKTRIVSLTGGEPTLHPGFENIVRTISKYDVNWTITTNGQNFREIYKILIENSTRLSGITFSIDGATAEVNDQIRGKGTYDKLIDAFKLAKRHGISFGVQCVIGTKNVHQIQDMVALAERIGADELNFVLMRPSPLNTQENMILTLEQAEEAEEKIGKLSDASQKLKISMATGYYSPYPLFVCRPLSTTMISIDNHGYLRFCPDLTNYRGAYDDKTDIIADLNKKSLRWGLKELAKRIALYWHNKIDWAVDNELTASDYYPCFYCLRYFNKSSCEDI